MLCPAGRFASEGVALCTPCPFGTYASVAGSAGCTHCPTALPFSMMGCTSPVSCMCPAGHSCSGTPGSVPVTCMEGTFSLAGSAECKPCPRFTVSPARADACLPECPTRVGLAFGGMYVGGASAKPPFQLPLQRSYLLCVLSLWALAEVALGKQPMPPLSLHCLPYTCLWWPWTGRLSCRCRVCFARCNSIHSSLLYACFTLCLSWPGKRTPWHQICTLWGALGTLGPGP